MLCAKINSLENALEKEKELREDLKDEYLKAEHKWRKEMSQLSLEKQLLLNEQKLANDKNEDDMKKVLVELKDPILLVLRHVEVLGVLCHCV